MANIKSTEQLKAMFQQSKEQKEKEREQQRLEKQQQYKDLCKEADRLLKEAIRDEKKKKMEQLSTLIQKTSQRQNKQHYINIDNNRWIDKGHVYHLTREELEELEPNAINWKKWDEIVNQTRQQFNDMGFDMRKQHRDGFKYKGSGIHIYAYTLDNNLLGHYQSSPEAAEALHIPLGTVSTTLYGCGICKKHGIKLYKHPL